MGKTLTSVNGSVGRRVGLSFNQDNTQMTVFLTQEEFMFLMHQMFDYRDAHKDELLEVIRNMEKR